MKQSLGAKTLVCPTPVYLVGSYDAEDKPNIMAVAWGSICCSQPPAVGVSLRKATYSYGNIVRHQAFTVNIPSVAQVKEADYAGIYSGRDEDKFAALGWTPVKSDLVHAPYIGECALVVECKVIHSIEIGLHTQFIGEILDVKADKKILNEAGQIEMSALQPFVFAPGDRGWGYYCIGKQIGHGFSIGKKE